MNRAPLNQASLPESVQAILTMARQDLQPTEILLFGSRARGTSTDTSDFDIAFRGVEDDVRWTAFYNYVIHEAPTLYGMDVVRYENASSDLRARIDEEGRPVIESAAA